MTKQVRDWHKDKEFMNKKAPLSYNDLGVICYEIAPYWHEKAAELEFWRNEGTAAKVQLIKAEAREKKLIQNLKSYMPHMWPEMAAHFEVVLASLYPKEEEAK